MECIASILDYATPGMESLFIKLTSKNMSLILGCIYRPSFCNLGDDHGVLSCIREVIHSYDRVYIFGLSEVTALSCHRLNY